MSGPVVSPPLDPSAVAVAAATPADSPATMAAVELFGVRLIGFTPQVGRQILLTVALLAIFLLINRGLRALNWRLFGHRKSARARFWVQQTVAITSTIVLVVGLISIWFENPSRLTTAAGLVSAGVAVALQRVITAFAAYLVILRGKVFNIGDRIAMAGVRGDVVDLGFIRTTILEMGQSPGERDEEHSVWVWSRQYTGRIITVTNDKIFEDPVYNYSTELPFLWEELHVPVPHTADWKRAEQILLEAAKAHAKTTTEVARDALAHLRRSYPLEPASLDPRTYIRLTDHWIDIAVRFVAPTRGVRPIKDRMSRDILERFAANGISIAAPTMEIVGLPPLRIEDGQLNRGRAEPRPTTASSPASPATREARREGGVGRAGGGNGPPS